MQKKILICLEVLVVFGVLIFYLFYEVIPEYRKSLGSSDSFVSAKDYQNMIEVSIDSQFDLAFLINSKGNIYHLFFFDKTSTILYNKNIENHSIEDALDLVFPILIQNGVYQSTSSVVIFHATDSFATSFLDVWKSRCLKYSLSDSIMEDSFALEERAQSLGIDEDSLSSILLGFDFYSKEMVRTYASQSAPLDWEHAKEYANHIYQRIEKYVLEESITSLKKGEGELYLSNIPAEETATYYPTQNSWYYVEEGKVYAYLEFQEKGNTYSYCYSGSIDLWKKGECDAS